jgi:hypothetical protein
MKTTPARAALLAKSIPSPLFDTLAVHGKALSAECSLYFPGARHPDRMGLRMLADEHDRQRDYTLCLGEGLPQERRSGRLV